MVKNGRRVRVEVWAFASLEENNISEPLPSTLSTPDQKFTPMYHRVTYILL